MSAYKPRLAIVSSHNICCALAYYADALKDLLSPCFDVEIIDLKTTQLLRQVGKHYEKMSEAHVEEMCSRLREFDLVNIHLELGIFGSSIDLITSRILKLCQAAGRLILTVHTIDYKAPEEGNTLVYQQIMSALKQRPSSNPFYLIAHLPHENTLLRKHFDVSNVVDFPLIYLTNKRREHFQNMRNPSSWKKQFGFKEEDITLGMFGLMSAHKNYLHALRTLNLLPAQYKLMVIGEAHHMSIKEWKVDPVIQEMLTYLDSHPAVAERVIFTGRRDDEKYYEDLANIDFVLLPSFEVGQSGSATFSNALELSCAILKSNTYNCREYEIYFPNCFEAFDIGNYYETKNKIMNFDREKLDNLRKRKDQFSEIQLQQMYLNLYEWMKEYAPIVLSNPTSLAKVTRNKNPRSFSLHKVTQSQSARKLFKLMPRPIQFLLKRLLRRSHNAKSS